MEVYGAASGQSINKQKTSILFSINTSNKTKKEVQEVVGVTLCHNPGTYLGLPLVIGKSKNKNFGLLKDRIWHKFHI